MGFENDGIRFSWKHYKLLSSVRSYIDLVCNWTKKGITKWEALGITVNAGSCVSMGTTWSLVARIIRWSWFGHGMAMFWLTSYRRNSPSSSSANGSPVASAIAATDQCRHRP